MRLGERARSRRQLLAKGGRARRRAARPGVRQEAPHRADGQVAGGRRLCHLAARREAALLRRGVVRAPPPDYNWLYSIRNAINHGDINADDRGELIRVEDRHQRLWMIVFGMLGLMIPIDRPLHTKSRRAF